MCVKVPATLVADNVPATLIADNVPATLIAKKFSVFLSGS